MPRNRNPLPAILAAIIASSTMSARAEPHVAGIPAHVAFGSTISCPSGVAVTGALPDQSGWTTNPIRWDTELANLYVTPRPNGGAVLTCSYVARQKDGVAIKDFTYAQVVGGGLACAVTPTRQFSCRALAAQ